MENFLKTSDVRETSIEVMQAICEIARQTKKSPEEIWEAPTEAEIAEVRAIVTIDGQLNARDYYWGAESL